MGADEDTFPKITTLEARRIHRRPPSFVRDFPKPDVGVDVFGAQGPRESEVDELDAGPPCHVRYLPVDVEVVAPPEVVVHRPPRYDDVARLYIPVYDWIESKTARARIIHPSIHPSRCDAKNELSKESQERMRIGIPNIERKPRRRRG